MTDAGRSTIRALPRGFRRNVVTTYATTIVSAAQVLLVTPLIVGGLGTQLYGIWALVGSVALFAGLLDLGLASATIRAVAYHEVRGERAEVVRTVDTTFWILLGLGLATFALGCAVAPLFPSVFSVPGQESASSILVVLVAASVALKIVAGTCQGALSGLQRYTLLNTIDICSILGQTAAFALVLALDGKLVALGVGLLVATTAEVAGRFVALRRVIPAVTFSPRNIGRRFAAGLLRMSLWISSAQLASTIRYRIDIIVVGFVVSVPAAGVYAVGQMFFIAADRFTRPLLTGFFPFSAELLGRRDTASLRVAMMSGTRIALAVAGPLCVTTMLLAPAALQAWVGSGFEDAEPVVVYLVGALLLAAVSRTGLLMLQGSGNFRITSSILWSEAVVNLALSIVLGLTLGIGGVGLATLLATALVSVTIGVPTICRSFGVPTARFVATILRAHVPAIVLAILVSRVVQPAPDGDLAPLLGAAAAIAVTYLATLLVTGANGAERRLLWASVEGTLRKVARGGG